MTATNNYEKHNSPDSSSCRLKNDDMNLKTFFMFEAESPWTSNVGLWGQYYREAVDIVVR